MALQSPEKTGRLPVIKKYIVALFRFVALRAGGLFDVIFDIHQKPGIACS